MLSLHASSKVSSCPHEQISIPSAYRTCRSILCLGTSPYWAAEHPAVPVFCVPWHVLLPLPCVLSLLLPHLLLAITLRMDVVWGRAIVLLHVYVLH